MAFAQNQDQWDRLRADQSFINSSVNQNLRRTTAVAYPVRVATKDAVLGGQKFVAGAALSMLRTLANHVEAEFDEQILIVPGELSREKRTVSASLVCDGANCATGL